MTKAADLPLPTAAAGITGSGGPVIPLAVPDLRGNEAAYLQECVATNWVSSAGPFVTEFERRMAARCKRAHGIATVNGTAALHLALRIAGVGEGDFVVVPDWTFAATANAVLHAGAQPVFVDVSGASWTLDPALVEAAFGATRDDPIAAVVAVHALGHPADMDVLAAVCRRHGAVLIEDAAGAIGARYKGRPVGGLGDAAIFSFNGNKTVTAGGGGMIVTDDDAWAARARSLSIQARIGGDYRYEEAGFNYRMTNVNAALGLAQLERLDDMVGAKRAIAERYDAALRDRSDLEAMPRRAWAESACWLYSVRCASRTEAVRLVAHLAAYGIEARRFWESLSNQAPYADAARHLTGVAARLSGTVVSLPCSSHLSGADQDRVIAALRTWHGAPVGEAVPC